MKKTTVAIIISSLALLFAFSSGAEAKTATDGNLRVTYDDPLFAVTNGAPGKTYASDVTVENLGGADKRFQFELDIAASSSNLTDRLFLRVYSVDEAGTEYCEWGCAEDKIVSNIDREEKFVKIIPGDSTKLMRFALTFDPDANDDFQGLSAGFDMKIGFEDQFEEATGGDGGAAAAGGGAAPTGFLATLFSPAGTTAGAETGGGTSAGQEGEVKGEEAAPGIVEGEQIATCRSWPKWAWVLMLAVYFAAFLRRTFNNFEEQVKKRDIRWKWQAVLTAAAVLIWQIFDGCRNYQWFVLIAVIGGVVVYLYYLYLFRKNIQRNNEEIRQ